MTVNPHVIKKAASVLRALNHKLRQVIIETINEKGQANVTELYVHLRLENSVTSQHLAILRKAGIVTTSRNGKQIIYKVDNDRINSIELLSASITRN